MKIEYYMNLIMLCLYGEFYTIMMFGRSLSHFLLLSLYAIKLTVSEIRVINR